MEVQYEMLAQQDGVSLRSYTRGFKSSWKMEHLFGVKKNLKPRCIFFIIHIFQELPRLPQILCHCCMSYEVKESGSEKVKGLELF